MMAQGTTRRGADVLAIGFAATVCMWGIAYVSLMQPGLVVGEVLFVAILMVAVAGGLFAARLAGRGIVGGAMVGLVCGLLNLLLVGSLIAGEQPGQWIASAALWAGGTIAVPTVLAAIGAAIGAAFQGPRPKAQGTDRNWTFIFVMVAASAVLLLLLTGGLVTTLGAGLAVPDWPTSFGHNMLLFPLSKMSIDDGTYYEHAHRLYGMLVGVTGITLAVCMFIWDRRWTVWALGVVILVMICVQGYMGGMRVTENSIALAVVHGINGQVIFALTVSLAMMLTHAWKRDPTRQTPGAGLDRGLSIALLAAVLVQIFMGAMYRHLQAVPEPSIGALMGLRHGHAFLGSTLVIVLALVVSMRAVSANDDIPPVKRAGKALLHTMILQVVLGVAAFLVVPTNPRPVTDAVPLAETMIATAHQVIGAVLLAAVLVNALWAWRMLAKSPVHAKPHAA
jgi:cytochrome c oxidase assembly protein subunit 15